LIFAIESAKDLLFMGDADTRKLDLIGSALNLGVQACVRRCSAERHRERQQKYYKTTAEQGSSPTAVAVNMEGGLSKGR
jgi:hypothetical protein